MENQEVLKDVADYVTGLFEQYQRIKLAYHNLTHTQNVVRRAGEIAANFSLSDTELLIVTVAAWFHDTGQLAGGPKKHEDRSVAIMKSFLQSKEIPEEIISKIEGCICATKLFENPQTVLEEIVCDADTYNLGTEEFLTTDHLLKKECILRNIPVDHWEEKTLSLLECHKYFTPYCKALLKKGKEKNIELVRSLLKSEQPK